MTRTGLLSKQFKPSSYQLIFNRDNGNKIGNTIIIEGQKTGRPSKRLTFHQKNLKIQAAEIIYTSRRGESRQYQISRINHHGSFEEVRLHTHELLYPGQYKVKMDYIVKEVGKENPLSTNPQQSWRALFPCIDEAEARANVKVEIVDEK